MEIVLVVNWILCLVVAILGAMVFLLLDRRDSPPGRSMLDRVIRKRIRSSEEPAKKTRNQRIHSLDAETAEAPKP